VRESKDTQEIQNLQISVANRNDHINVQRESIRNLRAQVGERDRIIRERDRELRDLRG